MCVTYTATKQVDHTAQAQLKCTNALELGVLDLLEALFGALQACGRGIVLSLGVLVDVELVVIIALALSLDDVLPQDLCDALRVFDGLACFCAATLEFAISAEVFAGGVTGSFQGRFVTWF